MGSALNKELKISESDKSSSGIPAYLYPPPIVNYYRFKVEI
jgi:hypothetical protein